MASPPRVPQSQNKYFGENLKTCIFQDRLTIISVQGQNCLNGRKFNVDNFLLFCDVTSELPSEQNVWFLSWIFLPEFDQKVC
jgi:hypothetical protein